MRALVQRVSQAAVTVEGPDGSVEETGRIGPGLLVLVGATTTDSKTEAKRLAAKLLKLRIFDDDEGRMNRSVVDVAAGNGSSPQVLVVSQFTLYGDASKGNRPSYIEAARPEVAEPLVDQVVAELEALGATVAAGRFQTHMHVTSTNDGPVTIWIEV